VNSKIKVILFDLGNVLIDFDYSIAVKRIAHFSKVPLEEIPGLLLSSNLTRVFEEGKITPEEFFLQLKEMLGLGISYERFVGIWNEVFFLSAKNRSVYNLANTLRNKYKIALLSNINILHFEYLKERFPVFNIFHEIFISCKLGFTKPNQEIYKKVIGLLGVSPDEVFYTDDKVELVKSAAALNINSFVFRDIKKLKDDFNLTGILLN